MLIKKIAAGLAAGAALALFMGAGAAQAGAAVAVATTPNPSFAGQSVTLSWSYGTICSGSNVEFRDITGGGSKPLCSATADATGAASCQTNLLTDTGARTIRGDATAGPCVLVGAAAPTHTVNAAPPPPPIPTTSEWTLWSLTGLLLIGGGVFASRRFRATAA